MTKLYDLEFYTNQVQKKSYASESQVEILKSKVSYMRRYLSEIVSENKTDTPNCTLELNHDLPQCEENTLQQFEYKYEQNEEDIMSSVLSIRGYNRNFEEFEKCKGEFLRALNELYMFYLPEGRWDKAYKT